MKTFYIETFGCQMNAHDSEKVVGTLLSEGYSQVADEADAGLILYNTCSIRDKAEQKVFHRLNEYKKLQGEGKRFAVIGCVAQQEGEKIFERAPYVSIVSGSASYRNLPQMLERRATIRPAISPRSSRSSSCRNSARRRCRCSATTSTTCRWRPAARSSGRMNRAISCSSCSMAPW